jgi:hypothetical protein
MVKFLLLFLSVLAINFAPNLAFAHSYTWHDPNFKLHLSYPDTWQQQGGLPANALWQAVAPNIDSPDDNAKCTLMAKRDKRFVIYPKNLMAQVVAHEASWQNWEQIMANADDLYFYYNNLGAIGRGDARYTLVDYTDNSNPREQTLMRALVFTSLYGDQQAQLICQAARPQFEKFADAFGKIASSIQFDDVQYAENYTGYYRDFLEQKTYRFKAHEPLVLLLLPRKTISRVVNCPKNKDYSACLSKPKQPQIQIP